MNRTSERYPPRNGDDAGFTLIELLIVIVILPILVAAVVAVIITSLDDQASTATRLSDSADSLVTSAFYVRDVQSAAYMTTTSSPATTPWTTPTSCGTGTSLILSLGWLNSSSQDVVSYWRTQLGAASNGTSTAGSMTFNSGTASIGRADVGQAIVETDNNGVIPFGTTVSGFNLSANTLRLSNTLSSSTANISFILGPQLVRDFCSGSSSATTTTVSADFFSPSTQAVITCASSAPATCSTSSTTWVATTGVTGITLAIKEPSGQYNYALTADPRVSGSIATGGGGGTGSTLPPFLMLGGGKVITQSDGTITVNGSAVINGGYIGQSNGQFTASPIETTDNPPSSACTQSGAQCKNTNPTSISSIPQPQPNPLAGIADPPEGTNRGCPGSFGNGNNTTLSPGEYTCQITLQGGLVTLQPGVYEFDQGVSISNGSMVGSGVLLYLPCKTGTGYQVDTWAPTCSEQLTMSNGSISVSPLVGSASYAGLWFWQNGGNPNPVSLSGPSTADSITGFMYAPTAQVKITGGSGVMSLGGIIASSVNISNGTINISGT